jgi:DNA-binding MarR family transcriptional regulator
MFVDKANTARAIKTLENEGYVCRQETAEDGRKKLVYVTDKAKAIEDEYHQIFKDMNAIMTKGFTAEEKDLVRTLLYRMRDNLAEYGKSRGHHKRRKKSTDHEY